MFREEMLMKGYFPVGNIYIFYCLKKLLKFLHLRSAISDPMACCHRLPKGMQQKLDPIHRSL